MKKKIYTSPEIDEMQGSVESGIAVSESSWFMKGGEGDFTFGVTEDESWG